MRDTTLTDRLLRGAEVAEVIGCSRAMAYRLMQRGTIPVVRIPGGKTVRVPRESLLEWIKVNTRAGIGVTVIKPNDVEPPASERVSKPSVSRKLRQQVGRKEYPSTGRG